MPHTVTLDELRMFMRDYWTQFASSSREKKTLEVSLCGQYRVKVDGATCYSGDSASDAVKFYNEEAN